MGMKLVLEKYSHLRTNDDDNGLQLMWLRMDRSKNCSLFVLATRKWIGRLFLSPSLRSVFPFVTLPRSLFLFRSPFCVCTRLCLPFENCFKLSVTHQWFVCSVSKNSNFSGTHTHVHCTHIHRWLSSKLFCWLHWFRWMHKRFTPTTHIYSLVADCNGIKNILFSGAKCSFFYKNNAWRIQYF